MGIDEYAPLAVRLYWISCNVVLVFIRRETQRGENLGKRLHPTATPHSESKKGTRILYHHFSLGRPTVFSQLFFVHWKSEQKIHQCEKNPSPVSGIFFPILDHQITSQQRPIEDQCSPFFFYRDNVISQRPAWQSEGETADTWISAGRTGGCQESLRGFIHS
jgi:hypothetical protein